MKICWDDIESMYLTRQGNLKKSNLLYIEMESCSVCGDPYLMSKREPTNFCSRSCSMIGKKHSLETRNKMSVDRSGEKHPMYGKHHAEETKNKISLAKLGIKLGKFSFEHSKNKSKAQTGDKNHQWKGGATKLNLPLFDTYSNQLAYVEKIRNNATFLEVRCTYCGKWFMPTRISVIRRIASLEGKASGESRLYCSDGCKKSCPTFHRKEWVRGFKPATSREVQPELRQVVFERDNYTCQKCGQLDVEIHCHHVDPVSQNPIESADMDNCVTLCKGCHKEVHKQEGCGYNELRCKE